jgi:hypothetical protein
MSIPFAWDLLDPPFMLVQLISDCQNTVEFDLNVALTETLRAPSGTRNA